MLWLCRIAENKESKSTELKGLEKAEDNPEGNEVEVSLQSVLRYRDLPIVTFLSAVLLRTQVFQFMFSPHLPPTLAHVGLFQPVRILLSLL